MRSILAAAHSRLWQPEIVIPLLLFVGTGFVLPGCSDEGDTIVFTPPTAVPTSADVSPTTQSIVSGGEAKVAAIARDADGARIGNSSFFTLVSSDPEIAAIVGQSTAEILFAGTDSAVVATTATYRGLRAGQATITATWIRPPDPEITGTATIVVTPGPAASLMVESGGDQVGPTGTTLPAPIVVRARDAAGNNTPGVPVAWLVTAGDGTLSETATVTADDGTSNVNLTLGTTPGIVQVRADVEGVSSAFVTALSVQALRIETTELPDGLKGTIYGAPIVATGGVDGSFAWRITDGALPPGLALETTGRIAGTPTDPGIFEFTVEVTSSDGQVATAPLSITVGTTLHAFVSVTSTGNVEVIDARTGAAVATIAVGGEPFGIALSPNGGTALVGNLNDVSVIDVASNTNTGTVTVGNGPFLSVFTPDGATALVTNNLSDNVSFVDVASGMETAKVVTGTGPTDIQITPDGATAVVANALDGSLSVIDIATRQVTQHTLALKPVGIAIEPGGNTVYVSDETGGAVRVVDISTGTVSKTIRVGNEPQAIVVGPGGDKLYVANWGSRSVSVIDLASETVVSTLTLTHRPLRIAITPDGSLAYLTTNTSELEVIDLGTDVVLSTIPAGSGTNWGLILVER